QSAQPTEPSATAADEMEVAFKRLCLRGKTVEQELTSQIVRQEEHYTGAIARQERHYKNRLRKQASEIQQLAAMLDEIAASTASLRSSRFWTFVNRVAAVEAKLFRNKALVPDRLRKIIRNYSRWRASHPEISNFDKPIHRAQSPASVDDSDTRLEHSTPGSVKMSKNSAKE